MLVRCLVQAQHISLVDMTTEFEDKFHNFKVVDDICVFSIAYYWLLALRLRFRRRLTCFICLDCVTRPYTAAHFGLVVIRLL